MDFLNQAAGQLRELMLSMTPAARVTALLLLGVIGVSLGYLVQHQSASPDDYLFNGEFLPGDVADRAEAAIARAGLEGYEREGNRIKVPRSRKSEFLAAVADGGALPPNFYQIVDEALDLSAFASGHTRREKLKSAREQRLSMIVSNMRGIEQAYVMFDVREPKGLARKGQATATVSVQPTPGEPLDARQVRRIREAVAGGVAELQPQDVVVTNSGDGSSYGGDEVSADSFEPGYYPTKLAYEENMQSKIENLLNYVPGLRVEVTAELEATLEQTTQTVAPESDPATLRRTKQNDTDTVSEVENGGRPGLDAQGPLRNRNEASSVTVKNEHTSEIEETDNFVGTKKVIRRDAALIPQDVRVAIAIPTNYLESVWRERERGKGNDPDQVLPNDKDAQLKSLQSFVSTEIKTAIVPLLPGELAENKLADIEVAFFQSMTPDPIESPTTVTRALGWASEHFNTMTMAFVALVSLMLLRSMVKSIPTPEPASAVQGPKLAVDTVEGLPAQAESPAGDVEESPRPRLRLKKGDSLKDDLVDIVREDPEAAAAILRSWIGNAG